MNGGSPVNNTLNETVAKLNEELENDANAPTTTTTTYEVPNRVSIWGIDDENELPKEILTTKNVLHGKPPSYKDAALGTGTIQRTPQRKTNQQNE